VDKVYPRSSYLYTLSCYLHCWWYYCCRVQITT